MSALSALLADLTSADDRRAERAAQSLAGHGQAAFTALCELLGATETDTRWWAVRALAEWPVSEQLLDRLIAALGDEAEQVRQCAALGLSRRPDARAIAPLIRALSDPDALTAELACNALIVIGKDALPALIEALGTPPGPARLGAVRALAAIRDPRAVPALMKALGEDSSLMQYWAGLGLDKLGLGMVYIKPE